MRGKGIYRTMMIWPYAVAPIIGDAVAVHVQPQFRHAGAALRAMGINWNPLLNADHAMTLIVAAATWKQIGQLISCSSSRACRPFPDPLLEAAAIDGATRRRGFWTITFPAAGADDLFSCWW